MSLQSSDYSSPKKKGYRTARFNIKSMGSMDPIQATAQSEQSISAGRPAMCSLAAPIPDVNPSRPGPGRAPARLLSDPDQRRIRVPNDDDWIWYLLTIPRMECTHHPRGNLPHTLAGPRPHQKCGSRPSPHHRPPTKWAHSDKQLPIGIHVTPMNPRAPVNTK